MADLLLLSVDDLLFGGFFCSLDIVLFHSSNGVLVKLFAAK